MEDTQNNPGQIKTREFIKDMVNNIDRIGIEGCFDQAYVKYLGENKVHKIKTTTINVLKDGIKKSLETTFFDLADLPNKFNELKTLEENYRSRTQTWRPPGNPEEHCRSARVESVLKLQKEIDLLIKVELMEIENLKVKIEEARKYNQVKRLNREISNHVESCLSMLKENEFKIKKIDQGSVIDYLRL